MLFEATSVDDFLQALESTKKTSNYAIQKPETYIPTESGVETAIAK